jgi:hypothetical protein
VRPVVVLLGVLVALALAGGASAAAPRVVQGDAKVGGLQVGRSGPAAARAAFGQPSSARPDSRVSCVLRWPGLGLRLRFLSFEGHACSRGVLVTATVARRAGWRTGRGLRVGDPVVRVRRLYPNARFRRAAAGRTGYWLVVRRACQEVGGAAYPGLLARTAGGRVTAIVASTAPCE